MSKKQTTSITTLVISMHRNLGQPLFLQIAAAVRNAIRAGQLESGSRMPSSRSFAVDLDVARSVVVNAYDQLVSEGYLVAHARVGLYVAAIAVEEPPAVPHSLELVQPRYAFVPSVPDPSLFPRRAWITATRHIMATTPNNAFSYGGSRGSDALRQVLADYLARVRSVVAPFPQIIVCSGFGQALRLICQVLLARGQPCIAVEDPTHPFLREYVRGTGMAMFAIPVDEEGLSVTHLAASGARAVVVTPAHQFPLGVIMSPQRRAALLAWAQSCDGVIIEDDYDAEFRYDRTPIGALQGMVPERVIYGGTASKTLSPALRLGWMVVPSWLLEEMRWAKWYADQFSGRIDQEILAYLLLTGEFERHIRRVRQIYHRRRDLLVDMLTTHIPDAAIGGIAAGLTLVLHLPRDMDEEALICTTRHHDVEVWGLRQFYQNQERAYPGLVLGYAALPELTLKMGVIALRKAFMANRR